MKCDQMNKKWIYILGAIFMFGLIAWNVSAQDSSTLPTNEVGETIHKLGLFILGNTQDESGNGLSIGLEYEYQWSERLGTGAMVEYAGGDHNAWVTGVPIFLHPHAGWSFWLMPGVEIEEEENSFLVRAGGGYDFEIAPKWSLVPEFNIDFIEGGETKFIYGLAIEREF